MKGKDRRADHHTYNEERKASVREAMEKYSARKKGVPVFASSFPHSKNPKIWIPKTGVTIPKIYKARGEVMSSLREPTVSLNSKGWPKNQSYAQILKKAGMKMPKYYW